MESHKLGIASGANSQGRRREKSSFSCTQILSSDLKGALGFQNLLEYQKLLIPLRVLSY